MNNLREFAIGQPIAAAVSGIAAAGLGLTGKDTYGTDILTLTFSIWTIFCLAIDAWINRAQGWYTYANGFRLFLAIALLALIIFAAIQVSDISSSEFTFIGCLVMSLIVAILTAVLLVMRIREARKNNEAFPTGMPSTVPAWESAPPIEESTT